MKEPDPEVIKQLLVELRDVSKDKRRAAVMKLGMAGGDQAVRALMITVQNEYEDLIVRGRAALMLGKLRDTRAVDPLIRALDAPGFQTPHNAAEALGKLGDRRAIEPLLLLAAGNNDRTREAALKALDRLGYVADSGNQKPDENLLQPECEAN
ncbi:MAG: HEAT repeat domain-containing protein [Leptolyngbyaceae cyanobacterium SM2_5_2]|nr:HEAT repeat domain-containing protein [Leptolyngbyaceae cyanobacterium SM2_5_2]